MQCYIIKVALVATSPYYLCIEAAAAAAAAAATIAAG